MASRSAPLAALYELRDDLEKKIEIYRPGKDKEILDNPTTISGENILPGFILELSKIW